LGVPVAPDDVAVELVPDADEAEELDLELPHALTTAAIRNRQAATAASLLQRMAWLILGSPRLVQLLPALSRGRTRRLLGQRAADVNTIVNDLVVLLARRTPVE
jgi:hypothetical protein